MARLTEKEIALMAERNEIAGYFYKMPKKRGIALKNIEPDEITICSKVGDLMIETGVVCAYVDVVKDKLLWFGDENGRFDNFDVDYYYVWNCRP